MPFEKAGEDPMDIAWAFRCDTCGFPQRMVSPDEDVTTSTGACPCCGSKSWHLYAKDDQGRVRIIG